MKRGYIKFWRKVLCLPSAARRRFQVATGRTEKASGCSEYASQGILRLETGAGLAQASK